MAVEEAKRVFDIVEGGLGGRSLSRRSDAVERNRRERGVIVGRELLVSSRIGFGTEMLLYTGTGGVRCHAWAEIAGPEHIGRCHGGTCPGSVVRTLQCSDVACRTSP